MAKIRGVQGLMKRTFWIGSLTVLIIFMVIIIIGPLNVLSKISSFRGIIVLTGSMEPSLPTGSLLIARKLNTNEIDRLAVGDILTYADPENPSRLVTHRITEVKIEAGEKTFITKGDANKSFDSEPVRPESIFGKVQASIPYLGFMFSLLKTRVGLIMMVMFPTIIIAINEIRHIFTNLKKENIPKESST